MKIESKRLIKAIVIWIVAVVLIAYIYTDKKYDLTDEEIENTYIQSLIQSDVEVVDKVIIDNKTLCFYKSEDSSYGVFSFTKGLNNKFDHEYMRSSNTYYQELYPEVKGKTYAVIVGENPTGNVIDCEINKSVMTRMNDNERFMLIFQPERLTKLPFEEVNFFDVNGKDITEDIKNI